MKTQDLILLTSSVRNRCERLHYSGREYMDLRCPLNIDESWDCRSLFYLFGHKDCRLDPSRPEGRPVSTIEPTCLLLRLFRL